MPRFENQTQLCTDLVLKRPELVSPEQFADMLRQHLKVSKRGLSSIFNTNSINLMCLVMN